MVLNNPQEHGLGDLLTMVSLGYKQSQGDHTLFIKDFVSSKLTLLLVYVDDMIIEDDEKEKVTLKEKLANQFEMKDMREIKYFLQIEVSYSKKKIFISRRKYVLDLLEEIGKLGRITSGVIELEAKRILL